MAKNNHPIRIWPQEMKLEYFDLTIYHPSLVLLNMVTEQINADLSDNYDTSPKVITPFDWMEMEPCETERKRIRPMAADPSIIVCVKKEIALNN